MIPTYIVGLILGESAVKIDRSALGLPLRLLAVVADALAVYSTAAQVIPVLLLVLIFERRGQVVEPEYERALRRLLRDADEDETAAIEAAISGIPPESSNLGAAMPTSQVIQHTIAGELRPTIQRSRTLASALSTVALLILVLDPSQTRDPRRLPLRPS
jgi:hypothetical protein